MLKHDGDFYCFICLHLYKTKRKLESHKNVCQNKDFRNILIFTEDTKVLERNQHQKSGKTPFIIYVDRESFMKTID